MRPASTLVCCMLAATVMMNASMAVGEEPLKVSIGTSSASIPASPARFAKEMGLYEKHGLDATITPMDNGSVVTAGLIAGSLDVISTGPSDVVVTQGRGQDVVVFSTAYRGVAATVVLSKAVVDRLGVKPDASTAERFKALGGLTIASPSATSPFTVAVKASAEAQGAKVNFTYMAQPAMVAALKTGTIQGMTVAAPYYVPPVLDGSGVIWISGPKGDFPKEFSAANSSAIATTRSYAQAHPDVIQKVSAVFRDFWKAVDERPADIKAAIAKLYPDLDSRTVDLVFENEANGFRGGTVTVEDMAHEIEFMKTGGIKLPNMDKLDPKKMLLH